MAGWKIDRRNRLTTAEGQQLLDYAKANCDVTTYTLIFLILHTGLRIGEVHNLQVERDIEWHDFPGIHVRNGKGSKYRFIHVDPGVIKQLRKYLKGRTEGPLFFEYIRKLQRMWERAVKGAGLRNGTGPHSGRHCFAVKLLEAGHDLSTIRDLLGHENIQTTSTYLACDDKKMVRAVTGLWRK